jgi:hypothetical protein
MFKGNGRTRRSRALLPASAVALVATFAALTPAAQATTCKTSPWNELEVAHEIIDIGTVYRGPEEALPTYKSAGDNPIPDSVWNAGYEPPSPYMANTTRNLQFNESRVHRVSGRARVQDGLHRHVRRLLVGRHVAGDQRHVALRQERLPGAFRAQRLLRGQSRHDPRTGRGEGHGQLQGPEHEVLGEPERREAGHPGGRAAAALLRP